MRKIQFCSSFNGNVIRKSLHKCFTLKVGSQCFQFGTVNVKFSIHLFFFDIYLSKPKNNWFGERLAKYRKKDDTWSCLGRST